MKTISCLPIAWLQSINMLIYCTQNIMGIMGTAPEGKFLITSGFIEVTLDIINLLSPPMKVVFSSPPACYSVSNIIKDLRNFQNLFSIDQHLCEWWVLSASLQTIYDEFWCIFMIQRNDTQKNWINSGVVPDDHLHRERFDSFLSDCG